jgi:hypothetical protein
VGTAGSVGTGAVDALNDIAQSVKSITAGFILTVLTEVLQLHCQNSKICFRALSWLIQWRSIHINGCIVHWKPVVLLVKNANALTDAFSFHPAYYNFDGEDEPQTNFMKEGYKTQGDFVR